LIFSYKKRLLFKYTDVFSDSFAAKNNVFTCTIKYPSTYAKELIALLLYHTNCNNVEFILNGKLIFMIRWRLWSWWWLI